MKSILTKHPKRGFGFRKDKLYFNGVFKNTLSFALGKVRLYFTV